MALMDAGRLAVERTIDDDGRGGQARVESDADIAA